jgi:site-specific DNA-methyltransferase (adenine-specific)
MSEGKRKLLFGDCLELMKLIPTGSVDLVVTDPPYEIEDMKPYFAEMLRCLSKDGSIYVFGNKNMIAEHWFSQMKIDKKELLIWHYKNSPKPKGRWRMSMQPIIYGYRGNSIFNEDDVRVEYNESTKKLNGRIRPSSGRMDKCSAYDTSKGALPRDVIERPALLGHLSKERTGHRDQKPLSIITDLVLASSNEGQLILDPFGGSGTTAEVCLRTNRQFITMELEPNNFEKIKVRLEDFNKSFSHETTFETEW